MGMTSNPAAILFDSDGNAVGVVQDGAVYRLQVQATVTDGGDGVAALEVDGTRTAQAVSYPELLSVAGAILERLDRVCAHLADITGEDDPL